MMIIIANRIKYKKYSTKYPILCVAFYAKVLFEKKPKGIFLQFI